MCGDGGWFMFFFNLVYCEVCSLGGFLEELFFLIWIRI